VQHRARRRAIGLCLLVTFLWATSWILIKIGLDDLDLRPVSFAGLRYALAALLLAPLGFRALRRAHLRGRLALDAPLAWRVVVLGIVFYAVAQGAQFAALSILPAAAVGVLLASIPVWVAAVAWLRGEEAASLRQVVGIGVLMAGMALYFGPVELSAAGWGGVLAAAGCIAASTASAHLSRDLNRDAQSRLGGAVGLTAASMAIGAVVLLGTGLVLEGWPPLDGRGWAIVVWLAVVNTAFAFTAYNAVLGVLTAVESSVIVNLLPVMVAGMAWIVLDERLAPLQVGGLLLAAGGAAFVQVVGSRRRDALTDERG
jgi:drug/metabolite transporter (DMT)-like permease